MDELFTIGHSQYSINYFIYLLKKYNINYVLDVRSIPYSRYAEQFNKENISTSLKKDNINYCFMGDYFGARPAELSLYSDEGYLDFEKVQKSMKFNIGMKNVLLGLEHKNRIVFMCTEKDPIDCHRAIMVSRAFEKNGIEVNHILQDGHVETQKQLETRLLDLYFPNRSQLTLFNYQNTLSEEEYISKAYHERNKDIGYRIASKDILMV